MAQYFVEINNNFAPDPLSVSADIASIKTITCNIDSIPQIQGSIATTHTIVANVQIPDIIHTEIYDGQYEIDPKAYTATILNTSGKTLLDNVTVKKIPYFETSNLSGYTVYIASEVD